MSRSVVNGSVVRAAMIHVQCRSPNRLRYRDANGNITFLDRFPLTESGQVAWTVPLPSYAPPVFTSSAVLARPVWADPESVGGLRFNVDLTHDANLPLSQRINRMSWTGKFALSDDGYPLNVVGRTGCKGRGCLGRWGPNHAADVVMTRTSFTMSYDPSSSFVPSSLHNNSHFTDDEHMTELLVIRRRDTDQWALPGGMVDPGERPIDAARREFAEEVLNVTEIPRPGQSSSLVDALVTLIDSLRIGFAGYVDDPRNTDNAWIETCAFFVDLNDAEMGQAFSTLQPLCCAGDDATEVGWVPVDAELYASHADIVAKSTAGNAKAD